MPETFERLKLLDLFSGIPAGGFSLGLERSGFFETVAFCEIDPFCRRVLKKHWPDIPCHDDVRTLTAAKLASDGIGVDAICGGFPCQDISLAGKGAGLDGERSGLWREYARLIRELRPRFVLVENVAALLGRGMGVVLGALFECGYDAVWRRIAAADLGAPHLRQRIWIVAYARGQQHEGFGDALWRAISAELARAAADAEGGDDGLRLAFARERCESQFGDGAVADVVADAPRNRRNAWRIGDAPEEEGRRESDRGSRRADVAHSDSDHVQRIIAVGVNAEERSRSFERPAGPCGAGVAPGICVLDRRAEGGGGREWWSTEPDVGRVAHGVPDRVDRLKGLGNAVVPQIPELIGRAIGASLMEARRP